MKKLLLVAVAAIVAVLAGSRLYADDFPSRPITLTQSVRPRQRQRHALPHHRRSARPALRQPVVVEDRPGADGALAALYVHHQPADGYNLLMATNSPLSADPFLSQGRRLRCGEGFRAGHAGRQLHADAGGQSEPADPFGQGPGRLCQGQSRQAVVTPAAIPPASSAARRSPTGPAIDVLHVPYKSTPPALEDIIAGRVSMMFADFTTAMPHVQSGALRALAISRIKRSSLFPDLPTLG